MNRLKYILFLCLPNFKHLTTLFQEETKSLRKRNIKVFNEILDSMPNLTFCTTWSEAQQMLLDNPRFTEDPDLQSKNSVFLINP